MSFNNNMEGVFGLIWKEENILPSQVRVARHENTSITCSVQITPSSKMEGEIVLRKPPVTVREFLPVKDSYVNEGVSKLNYGKYNILKVGTDENGYRHRTFIDFNISDLPRNMLVAEAVLELTSYDDIDFQYLELSSASREYEEYGLTWDNQVDRDKLISVESLDKSLKKYTFDVTNVVASDWYGKDFNNHGFILKGYDENKKQIKEFSSKESYNPPKLIVTYMDVATYEFGGSKLTGNVHIRTSWNNGITGRVKVNRYDDFHLLPAHVYVHNPAWMESSVFVSKTRIKGKVNVRQPETLLSNVQIRVIGDPVYLTGYVGINQTHVIGKVLIKQPKTLLGNVFIRSIKPIQGNVKVMAQNGLTCNVLVNPQRFSEITSNVIINSNIIKGSLRIKAQQSLTSSVTIKQNVEIVGNVVINNTALKSNVKIRTKGEKFLTGQVNVRVESSLSSSVTIAREYVVGKVKIVQHKALISNVSVRGRSTISGSVHVRLNRYKEVNGLVETRAQVPINGHVQVNSQFLHASVNVKEFKELIARTTVRTFDTMQSSVEIVYKKNLRSNVVVRIARFEDLSCCVTIKSKSGKRSYVFIM